MKKFFTWLKTAGIRSVGYFFVGVALLFFGFPFFSGACLGAFVMDNIVTIKELAKKVDL